MSFTVPDNKICDYIDEVFRKDTPEEYVRQIIEKRLVNELKYTRKQIKIEYMLHAGSQKPRVDIAVWDKACVDLTQENIKIIIECKKEAISADSVKDGIGQLKSYMSACANCEWGMWTNSKEKFVFRKIIDESGHISFDDYNDIPDASGNIDNIDRPKRNNLNNAYDDNLLLVFRRCHNYIAANDGLQKQPAFFEFLKVIFCKIEDEHNIPHPLEFYATSKERKSQDGQLTVVNRISRIFDKVKAKYKNFFDANDKIKLTSRSFAYVVSELQGYNLLNTHIDIKGKAYEEIVGANLRGDRGEFFTPRNVMKMAVEMVNPKENERILDSSCGTGGFLVLAMTHVVNQLRRDFEKDLGIAYSNWPQEYINNYISRAQEIAANNYFGFDINPELVKATKMNMVMNNDGSGNILQCNSLLPPHEWSEQAFKAPLANALGIDKNSIVNFNSISFFDVILTNPPFGSKIPVNDETVLRQFELARIWKKDKKTDTWIMTDRLQSSVPPEILFIERCYQFLKDDGRLGIILPDSILGAPSLKYIRAWMFTNFRVIASIDLPTETFEPRNGTQTSVLILQKKTKEEKDIEEKKRLMANYNIFMAIVDRVGHDRRGNPIFLKDEQGNDIFEYETDSEGVHHTQKIIDDQTPEVVDEFIKWKRREGISW
ncbi:MAG: N-6 DNA methylase [Synergistaceae bacterium]|nr:N-6 DNA methylase [Synergistaceae bacterium]